MVKLASLGNSRYLLPCHQNNEQGLVWFVAFKKQKTQKIEEEGCVFDLSIQTHNCFQLEHTVIVVWGSGKAVAPVKEKMLLGITRAPSQALLKLLKFVSHKICSHLHFILAENLIWKQISSSSLFTSEHNALKSFSSQRIFHPPDQAELVQSKLSWNWALWWMRDSECWQGFSAFLFLPCLRVQKCELCMAVVTSRIFLYLRSWS